VEPTALLQDRASVFFDKLSELEVAFVYVDLNPFEEVVEK